MKLVLTWLFVVCFTTIYGNDRTNCKILIGLLNDKNAQRVFYFNEYKHLPIIFIDKNCNFNNCNLVKINEKRVEIVHGSACLRETGMSYVIIHSLKKNHGKYKIEIQQKATGAYGYIEFKKAGNNFIVSRFDVGYF